MADHWDPAKYEEFAAEREMPFHDLLDMLSPARGGRGIDLGCGTGRLTAVMHERLGLDETLGVDSSPAMIRACAEHIRDGVRFEQGDLAETGRWLSEGPYDVVLSNAALHWVPDHPGLVARLASLVSEDGYLAVQVPANFDHLSHTIARELAREEPWAAALGTNARPLAVLAPERYAEILHGLGFDGIDVRLRVYLHVLQDSGAVVDWVKGTLLNWYRQRLPGDLWPGFLEAYTRRFGEAVPETGPYLYTFKRILFTAHRAMRRRSLRL